MSTYDMNNEDIANDIAVVGLYCRFPGANSVEQFWENLIAGRESIRKFSDDELRANGVSEELIAHPDYVKAQGVLDDIKGFDAKFFGISPSEAEMMDPQHRAFLEGSWAALEDAGYDPDKYDGRIGVYAGSGLNSYLLNCMMNNPKAVMDKGDYLVLTTSDKDYMPTRVSYKLDLKGPSMSVSTACSTSLVAVDMAVQSLIAYQSDMVLAGGVTLQTPHHAGYLYEEGGTQSSDGHCRPFDDQSSGLVGGSGVGIVVLKRLEDALEDGDNISAVIKGTAVNNDGALKVGYTSPSVNGQAEVIAEAQENAGVEPESIGYIEAHGTGTKLGDPIEIKALSEAFGRKTQKKQFCKIGSVKSNIGHLDSAAGVAGLIKAIMSVKHGQIPATLHFKQPNHQIDFENSPFVVNDTLSDWSEAQGPRRAGISSFGIGGTNAHVVVEQPPEQTSQKATQVPAQLMVLSAKTQTALSQMKENFANHLEKHDDIDLGDAAYTLANGRKTLDYRAFAVGGNTQAIGEGLSAKEAVLAMDRSTVFMFTGQGSQYLGMGKELYCHHDIFKQEIDACADILSKYSKIDLKAIVLGEETVDVNQTEIAQPLLFSVEYALAKVLNSIDIKPDMMIGHSIGEYVAATLAGVFSLDDALKVVVQRGRLMQSMPEGDMLAVALEADVLQDKLPKGIEIATINAKDRCVVAGPSADIKAFQEQLEKEGESCQLLHTSHAFHSASMDGMLDGFKAVFSDVELHAPDLPFISNLTGHEITAEQATDANYWADHLRHTVQFAQGLETILDQQGKSLFIEIGAGNSLCRFVERYQDSYSKLACVSTLGQAREKRCAYYAFLEGIGHYWSLGGTLSWEGLYSPQDHQRLSLPTYPFEHQPYWIDQKIGAQSLKDDMGMARKEMKDWLYVPSWKRSAPLISQHVQTAGVYLVFMDDHEVGTQLSAELSDRDACVIEVQKADDFTQISDHVFALNPNEKGHYTQLIDALTAQDLFPDHIIHLWTLGEEGHNLQDKAEHVLEHGFYSLVSLVQSVALRLSGQKEGLNLTIVTNNLCDLFGNLDVSPEKATILGPLRVTPLEHPEIHCKAIDIELGHVSNLLNEICVDRAFEKNGNLVALRGRSRWEQQFEPLTDVANNSEEPSLLKENGTYMIAGGTSGIGLEVARYLAQNYQANLTLMGASDLPKRETWEEVLLDQGQGDIELENLLDVDVVALEAKNEKELGIKGIETYGDFVTKVDRLCTLYMCRYFAQSGLNTEVGKTYQRQDLHEHFAILDVFSKLFNYILKILHQDDIISITGDEIEFLRDPALQDNPDQLREELIEEFPDFKPIFDVFERCMIYYAQALSGEESAVGVLFPEGGESIWDRATKEIPEHTRHHVYTQMARDLVLEKIAKHPERKIKILELGAGAGVFTDVVLPALEGADVEYTFTDISKSFLFRAEERAKKEGLDFMKFGILDISQDPVSQGFKAGDYDIVLELDCVHATSRMNETMAQVRKLLAPDGMLLFVESVITRRWMNLPLGLLEGWWYYEDEAIREDSPLLSLESWETLLKQTGFKVETYPQAGQRRRDGESGLIIGELNEQEGELAKVQDKIRNLIELEQKGANVLALSCDVGDENALSDAIDQTTEKFGQINGFVQTAAFENRGPIVMKERHSGQNEFGPKVKGTLNIDKLLQGQGLDFILLSSSHSAFDVGAGDVEYCSSNSYVDSFAQMKAHRDTTPVISVNWERWRGVGMAKAYEAMLKKRLGYIPEGGVTPEEGQQTFANIMALDPLPAQVIMSVCDFNAKVQAGDQFFNVNKEKKLVESEIIVSTQGQENYVAPETDAQEKLVDIWKDVLGVQVLGIRDNFYDLGGDSLIAVKAVSRMREAFGAEVNVNHLFENPTIEALSDKLEILCWSVQGLTDASQGLEEGAL